jgi:hypothetical protein
MKFFAVVLVLLSAVAEANFSVPKEVDLAFNTVHMLARRSKVRNLFMFNYTYYAKGFCKDQDCSATNLQQQMDIAKNKMGNDFEAYNLDIESYARAIKSLQSKLSSGDLATLVSQRSFQQIFDDRIFVSCVDFAKGVMGRALEMGFPKENLKIFVTMIEDAYLRMCPLRDGRQPTMPRPVVHTLVAYFVLGQWYALNVEDPNALPILLGTKLPERLSTHYQFTFPALIAYQKLIFAGAFPAEAFIGGYPLAWLVGITASGKLEADTNLVRCE